MELAAALREVDEIRRGLDDAFDALMDAADAGRAALAGPAPDAGGVLEAMDAVVAACAFNDLAGQRLARLHALLTGDGETREDAHLLAGPAHAGEGLGQDDIDRLLAAG